MASLRLALVFALLAGSAGADEAAVKEARARFDQGTNLYAIERYDDAIKEFEAGFLLVPRPEFLYNIGRAHREARRPEQAARYFERYLDLVPNAPDRAEVEREIVRLRALAAAPSGTSPAAAAKPELTPVAAAPAAPTRSPIIAAPEEAVSARPGTPAPDATPVYRRWWLWTGVAVVAVAVGAGLAVGLTSAGSATPTASTDFGTYAPAFP